MRKIVCAAVKYPSGLMLVGPRHFDTVMRNQFHALKIAYEEKENTQGFLDQHGVFLTREEAWPIAESAGQIMRRVGGDGKKLFSENLY